MRCGLPAFRSMVSVTLIWTPDGKVVSIVTGARSPTPQPFPTSLLSSHTFTRTAKKLEFIGFQVWNIRLLSPTPPSLERPTIFRTYSQFRIEQAMPLAYREPRLLITIRLILQSRAHRNT